VAGTFPIQSVGFKTSPQRVDWSTLDETWAAAAELDVFEAGWLNDHLTDMSDDGGPSLEALTLLATLCHHVPGKWTGHSVLSNTFRHPAVLAKAATVLDHATGGRFVLGLGAGWHEGEHRAFGIPLPPIKERIDRLESAVDVLAALFSGRPVSRTDDWYPLEDAVNDPATVTSGGPPLFLGGQRPRGIRLAARHAQGWFLPGVNESDPEYFADRRDALRRALEAEGRNPDAFVFAAQVHCGPSADDRRRNLAAARQMRKAGANHVILGIPAHLGPELLIAVAREVAEPLKADG
jgi:alkanesulfonate monooxygenase SsuD/methylene tetrahydromethanopterin reductase-like flavin-dependent oxidoreductase (luciferase family)